MGGSLGRESTTQPPIKEEGELLPHRHLHVVAMGMGGANHTSASGQWGQQGDPSPPLLVGRAAPAFRKSMGGLVGRSMGWLVATRFVILHTKLGLRTPRISTKVSIIKLC